MSQPYRPHSAHPAQYVHVPGAPKPRPSAAWFGVGGALLVVAAIFLVLAAHRAVDLFSRVDATFPASGTHQVTLPPHTTRALFVEAHGRFHCRAHDGYGAPVHFVRPGTAGQGAWVWEDSFDTGDGHLTFVCGAGARSHAALVRVVPLPSGGDLIQLGIGGLVWLVLGGIGFVLLLVTTILWIARAPAPSGAPPAWRPPGG